MALHVVSHAVAEDALALLRARDTNPHDFRGLSRRISLVLVAEATRDLPLAETEVETPLEPTRVRRVDQRVVAIPVLRAGLGMLDAFLEFVPSAEVGYLGYERDEETAVARCYYEKLPPDLGEALVYLLDPMLATGGSAAQAIEGLSSRGATTVRLVSIVSAPEGVEHLKQVAPATEVWTAALDRELNDRKYICPGLGDFGDRLFGTT